MATRRRKEGLLTETWRSLLVAFWLMFLTFPILVIKVNTIEKVIQWRWWNMIYIGLGSFFLSFLWRRLLALREVGRGRSREIPVQPSGLMERLWTRPALRRSALVTVAGLGLAFPFIFSIYQTTIMSTALIYVMLGLGLNIVVGLAGLLDLGYVAFYAVGAYSYALLNHHYGWSFWLCLPIGAGIGAVFGILLGFPVLRLKGDYLAIVTLGFGEIIRLILENWGEFSNGPSGIAGIARPGLLGLTLTHNQHVVYFYYLISALVLFTIFVVGRLKDSRIGRAWLALREDEIACQAMGIDVTRTKLRAFALGATWAGMAGVLFAAKTTFINPASFTFMESAIILSIVVLGGMGSVIGVVLGALVLILLPEYLRAFAEYRLLIFGAAIVLVMIFRPAGFISSVRRRYRFSDQPTPERTP